MSTNVLIIGSGGREHAIAWKLAQSPRIGKLFVAPGNGGTRQVAQNIAIKADDVRGLVEFAVQNHIDLAVVGSEDALAVGVVDDLQAAGIRTFGPTQAAAKIETSKIFSKRLMADSRIPSADYEVFDDCDEAIAYVKGKRFPVVVKVPGLAKGKGVYICHNFDDVEKALVEILIEHRYGDTGRSAIVEEFLYGQEISIHALSDGKTTILLPPARDHKAVNNNDKGKNTGGMGAIVPVPNIGADTLTFIEVKIVQRALEALALRGLEFQGLLFPGLKLTLEGPKVLEFNARFGDPETQSYMRLLKSDLLDVLEACVDGTLSDIRIDWHPGFAVCVVLASEGYPGNYVTGLPIRGISDAEIPSDVVVFHAGTEFDGGGCKTSGGRVLSVTATGLTLKQAINRAYEAVRLIHFEGMQYRTDIGAKSL